MNELEAIGTTDSGNTLFLFPSNGHEFTFEVISFDEMRIYDVSTVPSADIEQQYDEFTRLESLPAPVRRAIVRSNYRLRSMEATLEGVMHGD